MNLLIHAQEGVCRPGDGLFLKIYRLPGLLGYGDYLAGIADNVVYNPLDFSGGRGGLVGKLSDLLRYYGEAAACFPCPRRFYGSVQGQEIGFPGNTVNALYDLPDGTGFIR